MPDWINSDSCFSRLHCNLCRTCGEWRRKVGAPDICPYGVGLEDLDITDERKYLLLESQMKKNEMLGLEQYFSLGKFDPTNPRQPADFIANKNHDVIPPVKQVLINIMKVKGPKLWNELHTFIINKDTNEELIKKFLTNFTPRVPCGMCRSSWVSLLKENPAPLNSKEEFFKWTVDMHNKVNEKLDKPIMSLDEAKQLYGFTM